MIFVASLLFATVASQNVSLLITRLLNALPAEHWGVSVSVFDVASARFNTVFERDALNLFQPASNNKLLATSLAYTTLGANFTWTTTIDAFGGDLCIRASGDPSITMSSLLNVVAQIEGTGVRYESLGVDFSELRGFETYPDSWEMGDLAWYYGAAPSALVVDENVATFAVKPGAAVGAPATLAFENALDDDIFEVTNNVVTVAPGAATSAITQSCLPFERGIVLDGRIALHDAPQTLTAAAPLANKRFHRLLGAMLQITNLTSSCSAPSGQSKVVGQISSPPLSDILDHCLQVSDNLYAELIFKALTLRLSSSNAMNYGVAVDALVKALPTSVVAGGVFPVDGSGLSRHNLLAPRALRALFEDLFMKLTPAEWLEFVSFLPTAAQSGTLQTRFKGTPAAGILHAKTGGMTGVNSLSGVIFRPTSPNRLVVFSIIANESPRKNSLIKADIDQIAVWLTSLI